jgi:hypothetical protein
MRPHRHLVLGKGALELLSKTLAERDSERAEWDRVSRSTDHVSG